MQYDFRRDFEEMDNAAIVRLAIGPQQRKLLGAWMGVGPAGARDAMGKPLPDGLAVPTLRAYHEIARRMLEIDVDPRGTQTLRIALIEQALDRLQKESKAEGDDK